MSMEYAVQMKSEILGWAFCAFGDIGEKRTTQSIEEAKSARDMLQRKWPHSTYRLACREVGDWCECREEK